MVDLDPKVNSTFVVDDNSVIKMSFYYQIYFLKKQPTFGGFQFMKSCQFPGQILPLLLTQQSYKQ